MDRREFLKLAAITTAGLSVPDSLNTFINTIEASEKIDLVVAHGVSPTEIIRAAIDALGRMKKFVSRGDIVVIKPNIGWDRLPEQAANTNPEVVATVVKLCYEAGAKKVKVFDRTCNDPRRCYKQSGIADAATAAGAEVSYIDDRKFRDVKIPNGLAIKSWPLYTELLEADKIINVPIAKHHGLSKLTLSMKNWMGVMGGSRNKIHQRLDESLVDLATVIKPNLTILDAVRILTANGPQGGNIEDVKKLNIVIAGIDQVAIDSYGATLFSMKGSDLGYVRIADKAGLGRMDLSKLKIKKINI
ncbi:MAG: DUF362 domain-containing protein [Nitrospira sp.]|nr:DUF362 domain-containing protein [Nitrospira sp.]